MKVSSIIQEPIYSADIIKTIVPEMDYDKILQTFFKIAEDREYSIVEPTPVISDFWNTTFNPSSSEVIYRFLENETSNQKYFTLQPCIRTNDLLRLDDSWHSLLFHIFSFFIIDIYSQFSFENELTNFLKIITLLLDCKLSDLYVTTSKTPFLPNTDLIFNDELLINIGINQKNIIKCAGSANYQKSSLITSTKHEVSMTGPRLEVFIKDDNEILREISTIEIANISVNNKISKNVFAFVVGLERITALQNQQTNLNSLFNRKNLIKTLCHNLLDPSMANTSIGYSAISNALAIIDGLAYITTEIIEHPQMNTVGFKHSYRGLKSEYKKIYREFERTMDTIGILPKLFIDTCQEETQRNLQDIYRIL